MFASVPFPFPFFIIEKKRSSPFGEKSDASLWQQGKGILKGRYAIWKENQNFVCFQIADCDFFLQNTTYSN